METSEGLNFCAPLLSPELTLGMTRVKGYCVLRDLQIVYDEVYLTEHIHSATRFLTFRCFWHPSKPA